MKITEQYEALPKIAKILLQVFLGGLIGGIYRILRYLETKNIVTLVVGILCLVTWCGQLHAWVVDLITEIRRTRFRSWQIEFRLPKTERCSSGAGGSWHRGAVPFFFPVRRFFPPPIGKP